MHDRPLAPPGRARRGEQVGPQHRAHPELARGGDRGGELGVRRGARELAGAARVTVAQRARLGVEPRVDLELDGVCAERRGRDERSDGFARRVARTREHDPAERSAVDELRHPLLPRRLAIDRAGALAHVREEARVPSPLEHVVRRRAAPELPHAPRTADLRDPGEEQAAHRRREVRRAEVAELRAHERRGELTPSLPPRPRAGAREPRAPVVQRPPPPGTRRRRPDRVEQPRLARMSEQVERRGSRELRSAVVGSARRQEHVDATRDRPVHRKLHPPDAGRHLGRVVVEAQLDGPGVGDARPDEHRLARGERALDVERRPFRPRRGEHRDRPALLPRRPRDPGFARRREVALENAHGAVGGEPPTPLGLTVTPSLEARSPARRRERRVARERVRRDAEPKRHWAVGPSWIAERRAQRVAGAAVLAPLEAEASARERLDPDAPGEVRGLQVGHRSEHHARGAGGDRRAEGERGDRGSRGGSVRARGVAERRGRRARPTESTRDAAGRVEARSLRRREADLVRAGESRAQRPPVGRRSARAAGGREREEQRDGGGGSGLARRADHPTRSSLGGSGGGVEPSAARWWIHSFMYFRRV